MHLNICEEQLWLASRLQQAATASSEEQSVSMPNRLLAFCLLPIVFGSGASVPRAGSTIARWSYSYALRLRALTTILISLLKRFKRKNLASVNHSWVVCVRDYRLSRRSWPCFNLAHLRIVLWPAHIAESAARVWSSVRFGSLDHMRV